MREELWIAEVKTRLAAQTLTAVTGGPAARTIKNVLRDFSQLGDDLERPLYLIDTSAKDSGDFLNVAQSRRVQPMVIWLEDEIDSTTTDIVDKTIRAMKGDVISGVFKNTGGTLDLSLGGNAIIVRHLTSRGIVSVASPGRIAIEALFHVEYRHAIADPTAVV